MLAIIGRVRRVGYDLASIAKRRVVSRAAGRARCMLRNASPTCMVMTRRISSRVDFENPATQLLEENESAGYKVYYQYGLPTRTQRNEYDDFNDQVWYGRVGEEITYKILGLSADTQYCDLFLLRDYHTHQIIGCNAIKRASCKLSTVLHTNEAEGGGDEKTFNYVIRRNTAISPPMQGKGLGKIIRKYSRELDELHVADYGLSVTDVQVKNAASYNLQIASGFEQICKLDVFFGSGSGKRGIDTDILRSYELSTLSLQDEGEYEQMVALHRQYLKRHTIIDLSVTPHDIDRGQPVYVIRHKASRRVVCAFQTHTARIQMRATNKFQSLAVNCLAKIFRQSFAFEQPLTLAQIWTLYMEASPNEHEPDMAKCIKALIKYSLQRNAATLAVIPIYPGNPFGEYVKRHKTQIFGMIGSFGHEKDNINVLMRFKGLDEAQKNVITSNAVMIKPPVPSF